MKKLLIVEDEMVIRTVLKRFINKRKIFDAIDLAEDGNQAEKMIKENEYDMILMDNLLPHKNGLTILEDCQEKIKSEKTQVIFMTGDANPEVVKKAMSFGAKKVLEKNVLDADEFIDDILAT